MFYTKKLRQPYPNELYHHGIKGQHWGVRNGPPYPLDAKTAKKIKSGKNESVRVSDKEYREMRRGKNKISKEDKTATSKYFGKYRKQQSSLKEVIDASDLPGLLNVAELIEQGHKNFQPKGHQGKRLLESDVRLVNMDIKTSNDVGLRNNCVKCSNALEMRRRGYDVQAGRAINGMLNSATQYYWNNAVAYKERYDNILSRIEKFGHHGSGEFIARRPDGSGHSVYFTNEKTKDGSYKTFFSDGQIGRIYSSLSDLYAAEGFDKSQFAQITRLDNATPNFGHMVEDSVLRMNYVKDNMNRILNTHTGYEYNTGTNWFLPKG